VKESLSDRNNEIVLCANCKFNWTQEEKQPFNYCPKCGTPTEKWQENTSILFRQLPTSRSLEKATSLFRKNEFESAARTSLIIVEEALKEKTKVDSHGFDLVSRAFSYKQNPQRQIIEPPLVSVNSLNTESERNEHDGIKLFCMGAMKGIRNIIAHSTAHIGPKTCFEIILISDLILDVINNGSITNERYCIWRKVKHSENK
jgi:uncharacterized protein (TIGR02391 family)